jgi:hypothetical protein
MALLGVIAAAYSTLETGGKGAFAVAHLMLVVHWIRAHQRRVPPDSRLNLHADGEVLLRLEGQVNWRGTLASQSWRSKHLVLLRVTLPFGSLWLPVWRHRQMRHQFRRLLVGLRHDRWKRSRADHR